MAKIVNLLLLLLLIGGVARIVLQTRALERLTDEHQRLASVHGELDVKDDTKFLVTAVETGDPMHFQWRVYYPAGLTLEERTGFGEQKDGGGSSSSNAGESILRCRFEFRSPNELMVHGIGRGGSRLMGFNRRGVVAFFKKHWSELEIAQLGDKGPVEIATDRTFELLMIKIPERLMPELEKRVGRGFQSRYYVPFYQSVYGTPVAFTVLDKKQSEASGE